jgi:hypothetical protein
MGQFAPDGAAVVAVEEANQPDAGGVGGSDDFFLLTHSSFIPFSQNI